MGFQLCGRNCVYLKECLCLWLAGEVQPKGARWVAELVA